MSDNTIRTVNGIKHWDKWEVDFHDMIDRTNRGNKDKVATKDFITRLITKEKAKKPLVIGDEIECRNCKTIISYMHSLTSTDKLIGFRRCQVCGQVQDWDEVKTLVMRSHNEQRR